MAKCKLFNMRKIINPEKNKVTLLPDEKKATGASKVFRDINEDDDGYHPYADRVEEAPVYEEDPWK